VGELGETPGTDLSLSRLGEDEVRNLRSLAAREQRERTESLDAALKEAARAPRVQLG
jgi:hypothetical protein